jgi:hypothetical protein
VGQFEAEMARHFTDTTVRNNGKMQQDLIDLGLLHEDERWELHGKARLR